MLQLKRSWKECTVAITNTDNDALRILTRELGKMLESQLGTDRPSLSEIVLDIIDDPLVKKLVGDLGKNTDFVYALTLMQYARLHDHEQR
jgi:hypothetical protein